MDAALSSRWPVSLPSASLRRTGPPFSGTATSTEGVRRRSQITNRATAAALPDARKLVSFGDDFWIENDRGEARVQVNGR